MKNNLNLSNLETDQLLNSVGRSVSNSDGDYVGEIVEITRDKNNKYIEYLILKSDEFFGRGSRFFAIPASSSLVNIQDSGNIILQANKDDLQFAKGVAVDKCPKPDFRIGQNIYELYKYKYEKSKEASHPNNTIIQI